MAAYLQEFLYRGVDPNGSNPGGATYHVILAEAGVDPWGAPIIQISVPMTPAAAATAGYNFANIATAINVATMAANTLLTTHVTALQAQVSSLGGTPV
jgi:hypothetical protein